MEVLIIVIQLDLVLLGPIWRWNVSMGMACEAVLTKAITYTCTHRAGWALSHTSYIHADTSGCVKRCQCPHPQVLAPYHTWSGTNTFLKVGGSRLVAMVSLARRDTFRKCYGREGSKFWTVIGCYGKKKGQSLGLHLAPWHVRKDQRLCWWSQW